MGVTPSVNLVNQELMNSNYFTVQMGFTDRLRLILAPEEVIQITQSVLNSTWPIQDIHRSTGFIEFKLAGSPWYSNGENDLNVKFFICSLLQQYYGIGWHLKASSDLTRNDSDTNVLFFHKEIPIKTSVICLSLNSSDKIRVLGPDNVYPIVKDAVSRTWSKGIQREQFYGKSYEIKLHGNPWTDWSRDSSESFNIPIMMCEIFNILFKNNWIFSGAIDTGKGQYSLNALYFRYDSEYINKQDLHNTNFFALSLNKSDRIRLHQATSDLVSIMTNISYGIPSLWRAGIQDQKLINGALEFKLKGNPWLSSGSEAVESRRLLNNLFNLLSRYGWNLYAVCDLTKDLSNKSTFFFRSKPIEPKTLINFCISLNESDKIRVIDANENIIEDVKVGIQQGWHKGIQELSNYHSSHQFKLKGFPFSTFGSDRIYTCVMMNFILQNIERRGFKLLCSADVSGAYVSNENDHYPLDLHSWFFEN